MTTINFACTIGYLFVMQIYVDASQYIGHPTGNNTYSCRATRAGGAFIGRGPGILRNDNGRNAEYGKITFTYWSIVSKCDNLWPKPEPDGDFMYILAREISQHVEVQHIFIFILQSR